MRPIEEDEWRDHEEKREAQQRERVEAEGLLGVLGCDDSGLWFSTHNARLGDVPMHLILNGQGVVVIKALKALLLDGSEL